MYSILFLGIIMISNAYGFKVPEWISPIVTFAIVGYFFQKSRMELKILEDSILEPTAKF